MAYLSGILQRPIVAASAVAIASVSTDLHEKFWPSKSLHNNSQEKEKITPWVSHISLSKLPHFLSYLTTILISLPILNNTTFTSLSTLLFLLLLCCSTLINQQHCPTLLIPSHIYIHLLLHLPRCCIHVTYLSQMHHRILIIHH
ncbi:hypothetical protein AABB24_002683 [Solanum stoloniferum]|uniref:Uncharacterized protein n=1 Tax=Solanum stoloniferum TaxID=62892 RepID=A0ABD2V838_9SOLN